jgi:3-methyladenine DNA glycosylase AlkC
MATNQSAQFSLKDHLFNADRVRYLAQLFFASNRGFEEARFMRAVMMPLPGLELKQRISHIAKMLEGFLADDFGTASGQILAALPPELDPSKTDDDFGDFIIAPLGEFVVRRGMAAEHFTLALKTLKEITKRFSMEDALRAFINSYPEQTLRELQRWSTDGNYHVRRLVSESTRPRLPWSGRLSIDHTLPLPLLDQLHADATRYVTRSVANHLNDISKTDPALVIRTLEKWRKLGRQDPTELDWICRHALRTLVKRGHAETMEFLGLRTKPKVTVSAILLSQSSLTAGESLEFSVTITAHQEEALIVDYVIDFVKANGSHSGKVFKAKRLKLSRGESVTIRKRHPLRANATTYTLFPGWHRVTLQINGVAQHSAEFEIR